MRWWPFSKKRDVSDNRQKNEELATAVFLQTIAGKCEDPLIGAKLGAKEIFQRLTQGMKDEKGVHIESLLCALGALAGFACQASVRGEYILEKGFDEKKVFTILGCANGRQYFFGDMVNKLLAESQYSIWSLAAGAVQHLGVNKLIDIGEIFKHTAQTVGGDSFGIPRIPQDHKPGDLPQNYLKHLWPVLFPVVKQFCPASEWPLLFGLAIQEGIYLGKDVLDPLLALSIVMESAIPMSKVDFNSL